LLRKLGALRDDAELQGSHDWRRLRRHSDEMHAASLLGFYAIFGDALTVDEAIAGPGVTAIEATA